MVADVPALLNAADPWAAATADQRRVAEMRATLVAPLAALVTQRHAAVTKVAEMFLSRHAAGTLDATARHALDILGAAGDEVVSLSTLKRWITAYAKTGRDGLLPRHTGRVRKDYGWEARAAQLYNLPSKPGFMGVALTLQREGFDSATESRVKAYLKKLPATLGEYSPQRVGQHLHKLTRRTFRRRHLDDVLIGEIYAGDGHTVDCYVAHPNTGKPYRPELTAFIDIKSKYIAGWYFTESESAQSTLFALSAAMVRHDHVPAWLYIDRGAGYRAKLLADESVGWYNKFDIAVIGALPGNPHGKGWIERWFRTCRDRHDKFFAGGQVYCGDDMAPEINRRLSAHIEQGKRTLPSLREYVASFAAFVEQYHNTPMDTLDGRTPAQVWAELTKVPVGMHADAVLRPRTEATVSRQQVRLHNRWYFHEALALYDAKRLTVEYDLHNDASVWISDDKGRFVCEAALVDKAPMLPVSRLEEQRDKRLQGQVKRLERHTAEALARRADAITAADQVAAIDALALPDATPAKASKRPARPTALPEQPVQTLDLINPIAAPVRRAEGEVIDILKWRDQ